MEYQPLLQTIHLPLTAEGNAIKNSFGIVIAMVRDAATAEALASIANLGEHAAKVEDAAMAEGKVKPLVPRDGDAAHRAGFRLEDNPFKKDGVDSNRHLNWVDDWKFRHDHCGRSAPDAPGGRLDPARAR